MGIIDYKPYPSNVSLLEDTHIIASALKKDQFFSHTKSEIAIFFKKNRDSESRINFLKSTYNNEFTQFTDDNGTVYGYKTYLAGLQIWQGNFMTKKADVFLTWNEVQNLYSDFIKNDELNTEESKEQDYEQITFFDLFENNTPF